MDGTDEDPPIHTTLHDPDLQEVLDRFVVGLGERIDHLQDEEIAGDWRNLATLATALAADAVRFGYPPLAEAANAVEKACSAGNPEGIRKRLLELTEIGRRVRLGHRSAA